MSYGIMKERDIAEIVIPELEFTMNVAGGGNISDIWGAFFLTFRWYF